MSGFRVILQKASPATSVKPVDTRATLRRFKLNSKKHRYSRRSWVLWQETSACNRVARGDGIRPMPRERKELSHYTCTNIHEQPQDRAKHDQVSRRWQRPARCVTSSGVALRRGDAKESIFLPMRKFSEKCQDKTQNMFWRGTLFMPDHRN